MGRAVVIDNEEIETLIDFHESMANDADESLEHEEARLRRNRAAALKRALKQSAA